MTAAHTKGPWKLGYWSGRCNKPEHSGNHPGHKGPNPCVYEPEFVAGGDFGIAADDGAMVVTASYDGEVKMTDADASLIIAAPDLLEIVRDLVSDCEGVVNAGFYRMAVNALAKAEGRS